MLKPKAYSYIRFSSPEQAKGDSYRRQRESAEQYCNANGMELVSSRDYLFFDKGRSAFRAKHLDDTGELARFLGYVEDGTVPTGSTLIVESLDRLSRERVKDALPRFLDLLNKGIKVYTSADGKLYTEDYNELDLIISIVHMSRAHNESNLKGQRVSKAWKQKQTLARTEKKPLGRACPYWLEFNNGEYHPLPERVEVVKRIFQLACDGYGHRAIAKILNEESVPVFGSLKRNLTGKWGSSSTGKILSNKALLGEYQPTGLVDGLRQLVGEPVKDFFPAVVSEEEYYAAQAARVSRNVSKATKPSKSFNVWQGIAKCGLCKGPLHLVNKGKPPKGGKYLRCYNNAKGVCPSKQFRLDRSEVVFKELLAKVDSLSLVQNSQGQLQRNVQVLDGKIAEVQSRLGELKEQVASVGKLPSFLVQTMVDLEDSLEDWQRQREQLKTDLSREKILSKTDFFQRLDLVSFQGRARANGLLKGLDITVTLSRRGKGLSTHIINYWAFSGDKTLLGIKDDGESLVFIPLTRPLTILSADQGDSFAIGMMEHLNRSRDISKVKGSRSVTAEDLARFHETMLDQIESEE